MYHIHCIVLHEKLPGALAIGRNFGLPLYLVSCFKQHNAGCLNTFVLALVVR